MIDIYTEKKESKDWILQNDLYFNLNTGNEEMSENEIKLIQQVDEAKLTPDKHIETKYGLGTIRNLSSGCKTLLNIVKHPDKVVCVEECGPNVLKFIFAMDDIKIYMSRPTLAEIPDDVTKRMQQLACQAFDALHLTSYARMDFLMEEDGSLYCLEANTLPGMTQTSLIPQEAAAIGMDYDTLCERLIEVSLK